MKASTNIYSRHNNLLVYSLEYSYYDEHYIFLMEGDKLTYIGCKTINKSLYTRYKYEVVAIGNSAYLQYSVADTEEAKRVFICN